MAAVGVAQDGAGSVLVECALCGARLREAELRVHETGCARIAEGLDGVAVPAVRTWELTCADCNGCGKRAFGLRCITCGGRGSMPT